MRVAILNNNDLFDLEQTALRLNSMKNKSETQISIFSFSDEYELIKKYNIDNLPFDLVYIDHIPSSSFGLNIIEKIHEMDANVLLVLLTNSENKNDFACACQNGAFRILFKPIDDAKFDEAWNSALSVYKKRQSKFLIITNASGIYKIPFSEIIRIESSGRVLTVYTKQKDISYYEKFGDIEKHLSSYGFFCSRKGCLVNMQYVVGIDRKSKELLMSIGMPIPISRERIHEFNTIFPTYKC